MGYLCWWTLQPGVRERDFQIFRAAAVAVVHGRSPYPPVIPEVLAHFDKFVYPPLSAILFIPLAQLSLPIGQAIMLFLGIICVLFTLRLLDVTDWRCYGLALLWAPALNSVLLGAITSLLLVGTAAAWRYRERPAASGSLAALVVVAKLFLWPLGLWLVATRRFRATAVCVLVSAALVVGGWAVIGFAGMRSYPHLLRVLSDVEQARGYGVVALAHVSGGAAEVVTLGLVAIVLLGIAAAARRDDADRRTFCIAVAGALLVTPLLWLHYFALLLVPIALYRPRLSGAWFLPLLFWLTPVTQPQGSVWRICLALAIFALVIVSTVGERWSGRFYRRVSRLSQGYRPAALRAAHPRSSNAG
jgi:alpha-1,2-mannosyltransferase